MEGKKIHIETTGHIKKEARLSTVENNTVSNTLVLESLHPFPGYHGKNLPERTSPRSLFLILTSEHQFSEIARITKKINQESKHNFNASIGKIYTRTHTYNCIRVKYLEKYSYLPEIQHRYQDEGIKFAKKKKVNTDGLIVIKKYFYIEEIEPNVYRDLDEPSKFYISLPQYLKWPDFKKKTLYIRNNLDGSNFDAAQGVFYRREGIIEIVRLYICEGEYDKIKLIQTKYKELINRD
ncbi:MAG: hypothetical protein MI739_01855 [Bacteroidales bacterium]|nr:hypothetical protein [Bacteroidales bacterium]